MNSILKSITVLVIVSCGISNQDTIRNNYLVKDSVILPTDSNTFYFPVRELSKSLTRDTFLNKWYSQMLFGLHEPVLYTSLDATETYRFTWLRTFHKPISIRLQNRFGDYILTLKMANGAGGYQIGKLIQDTSFYISKKEWNEFTSSINSIDFWKLPSADISEIGKDGSEWILEGQKNGKYHFVIRWTPNTPNTLKFRSCCEYLIKMSGLMVPNEEIY
ncbi:MAG: hypothetical protein B7Y37_01660 [Sphingobacteriia bacterium 28-36-52]|nr:MAG: hypothetical protein B7Y37_01660 [Sphingobacteriia bacterium 28-36-52]